MKATKNPTVLLRKTSITDLPPEFFDLRVSIKTLAPPPPIQLDRISSDGNISGSFAIDLLSEYFNMYFTKIKVAETDMVSVLEPF